MASPMRSTEGAFACGACAVGTATVGQAGKRHGDVMPGSRKLGLGLDGHHRLHDGAGAGCEVNSDELTGNGVGFLPQEALDNSG